ncbi:hypothetical protein P3S67_005091 [Capsicum chacoense]
MTVTPWLTLLSSMPKPLTFQKMARTFGSLTLMKPLSLTFLIMLVLRLALGKQMPTLVRSLSRGLMKENHQQCQAFCVCIKRC